MKKVDGNVDSYKISIERVIRATNILSLASLLFTSCQKWVVEVKFWTIDGNDPNKAL